MPAWAVKKAWTSSTIQLYRNYVTANGPSRSGVSRSTCEDLSIRMVVDFAENNNLPVFFCNGANPRGLDPARFKSKDQYLNAVLPSTGASDLLDYGTVAMVEGAQKGNSAASLPLAKPGDVIILYRGGTSRSSRRPARERWRSYKATSDRSRNAAVGSNGC